MKRSALALLFFLALGLNMRIVWAGAPPVYRPPPGVSAGPTLQPPPPLEPPRAGAKFDMTGYWVSIVSDDYQWRMITPPKGDFSSLPLTAAAVEVANRWDPAADEAAGLQCRPFGAPGLMRLPGRLRVSWQDDTTLKIETDAGQQTRLLRFGDVPAPQGEQGWQGHSVAAWQKVVQRGGQGLNQVAPGPGGSLKVVTTHLRPGYLRKNGVPYSERAVLTEYYNRIDEPNGDSWLIITSIIENAEYLLVPWITSTHFLREADGSKWNPTPCRTAPPLRSTAPPLDAGDIGPG